jgi:hypothetical protein
MPSYTHPFTLFRILLLPAALAYLYLNFYPALNDCAFPPARKVQTKCSSSYRCTESADEWECFSSSACKNTTVNAGKAPFRLLALADPQLEGDTSLPAGWQNSGAWDGLGKLWRHASTGDFGGLGRDFPVVLQGYRKKLDLWGTDWYLAHIYSQARWWASPTHTVVLGDLVGSQWIGDGEFEGRAERFWSRVFGSAERVPDAVTGREHEGEVLGANARDWRRRVIAVAGNHDVGYAGDLSEARVERFERAFGRVNWELTFRLPNATLDPNNSLAGRKVLDFYDGPAPQPELRLVVLNSMNLDEPAQSPALREQSLQSMEQTVCNPERFHNEHSATVLLTHIPMHKASGICVDGPFFSYFSNGGVREQNHLSEDLSKRLVDCLQNTQSSIVLNGHDHEGCDSFHYRDHFTPSIPSSDDGIVETPDSILKTIHHRDVPSLSVEQKAQSVREITVRSMMGSYGGHAGFLSGWFDSELGEWQFEYASCAFGVQHIWWVCHVLVYLLAALGVLSAVGALAGSVSEGREKVKMA